MSNQDTKAHIERLKKAASSRSPKPHRRLLASLAYFELQSFMRSLPGSVRRGLQRGRIPG